MSAIVDIQTISIAIASAGVLVGVVYYILDMRHQGKVRQTDLIMRLYSTLCSKEFMEATTRYLAADYEDYSDFVEKYGPIPSETPVQIAFGMVMTFYEGIGELLHKKLIDIDVIVDLFGVNKYWKKAEPLIRELRKREQFGSGQYEWFEYLYNEVKKREQQLVSKTA